MFGSQMKLFHATLMISASLYVSLSYAQENCSGLKFNSRELTACNARNYSFFEEQGRQQRRDEEARRAAGETRRLQEQQLDIQKQQLELQKRQQAEADAERWKREKEQRQKNATTQQVEAQAEREDEDVLVQEATAEVFAMGVWAMQRPNLSRVSALRKSGHCKAARALIHSEARGGSKSVRMFAENMQGQIAESCDKDIKLAKAHYLRAEQNGSKLAKVSLATLSRSVAKAEMSPVKPATGGLISSKEDSMEDSTKYIVVEGGYCNETADCIRGLSCIKNECKGGQEKALREMVRQRDYLEGLFTKLPELAVAKKVPSHENVRALFKAVMQTGVSLKTDVLDLADDGILNQSNSDRIIYGGPNVIEQVNEPRTAEGYLNISWKLLTNYGNDPAMVDRFKDPIRKVGGD
jgi:hypothetical protein